MSNDQNTPNGSASNGASQDASRDETVKAISARIDSVFGPGFARQIQEQAQARSVSAIPAPSSDALPTFIGNLSPSDKDALFLNQRSEFNQRLDDEITAELGVSGLSPQEALKSLFSRLKAKPASADDAAPTATPAPRKPGA